jgi:adenine deaminase
MVKEALKGPKAKPIGMARTGKGKYDQMKNIQGQLVNIPERRIFPAEITVENGKIVRIVEKAHQVQGYLLPGFIDSHIHIESSLLVPTEFARLAVVHGTVATVSDPHEIANVLGVEGVHFMVDNGKKSPLKFHFGAPSCVPATSFETAGAVLDAEATRQLLALPDIHYLAEMMNYPGVLHGDPEVLKKIAWAQHYNKPIDGHAPGLRGADAQKYLSAGITTDHECFSYEEAKEKLDLGMKVIIREGSAAKNFEALIPLLPEYFKNIMFCSDDKHPDDLVLGHINHLCARAVAKGIDVFKVLQVACTNPVQHYKMQVGQLRVGDAADFIRVVDLEDFEVLQTYLDGELVAENGISLLPAIPFEKPNNFKAHPTKVSDFHLTPSGKTIRVIEARDGELITGGLQLPVWSHHGNLVSDTAQDILKIAVVNRYQNSPPAIGFIKNFGLKKGAIASSVAHDSHNIIAVGTTDGELCLAVNLIIANKGGLCALGAGQEKSLPLPVAGIMGDRDGWETGRAYQELDAMAKQLGCTLKSPFMTLSFMALLVIPDLKLSDKGLFSGSTFGFVELQS